MANVTERILVYSERNKIHKIIIRMNANEMVKEVIDLTGGIHGFSIGWSFIIMCYDIFSLSL